MSAPTLPLNSCDCHVHLFGPASRYPFDPKRVYTPGEADEGELLALHARLGVARVVLVQPSVYGVDNRRLLDGLRLLGGRARAVAVVADDADEAELAALHAAGVRGLRVNLSTIGVDDPAQAWARIAAQARLAAAGGWHLQILAKAPLIAALADRLANLPCMIVLDHFGQPDLDAGPDHPDFRAIAELARAGKAMVKLSAMERLAGKRHLARLAPFLARLIEANPMGVVWGSDWPHTGGGRGLGRATLRPAGEIEPFEDIDDLEAIRALGDMLPCHEMHHALFVANPARLYGFAEDAP